MTLTQNGPLFGGPLLEVEGLSYSFNGLEAVDDVSFSIARGEIFGLLGPNGAGKTTTISCIAGLRRPHKGTMRFEGAAFTPGLDGAQRQRLGVVPQELALYDSLTGRENLEFFAATSGVARHTAKARVQAALELAGLQDRAKDRVKTYSGGMKRRLNLVIACLHEPELVILDEPTVGVDPQSRHHIFDALEALSRSGRTLLYTTHYMEEAERLCHRIAIMDAGRVIAIGTAAELAEKAGLPGKDLEQVFLSLTGKRLRD
ncbi:MAG: ABC transporter ATP-binding protein [Planctomycetota bacterium]